MAEQEQKDEVKLGTLTDDEVMNLDPDSLESDPATDPEPGKGQDGSEAAVDDRAGDNDSESAGGAAAEYKSPGSGDEGAATTSAEEENQAGTDDSPAGDQVQQSTDDQSDDKSSGDTEGTETSSGKIDFEVEYKRLMAPFKAAGRTITPENPEDVLRLMQMGVDYTRKMESMKPYQKVLKSLERNELLDPETVNFMIDLQKGNPEAITKFLKDRKIDPIDLDLEDDASYTPNDHMLGDEDLELEAVLDDIKDRPSFNRTAKVVSKEWDKASQKVLQGTPSIIAIISDHMESGIYDQIADRVANDRTFGKLKGLSDLEAYKAVGDAIQEGEGFQRLNPDGTLATQQTDQGHSQDPNGSDGQSEAAALEARKRAASPTKGTVSAGKQHPNFLGKDISDDEILKMDVNSL